MSNLAAESLLSPIERARFSAELLTVRESLTGGSLSPIESVRLSARGLELRALLGGAPKREPEGPTSIVLTGNEFGEFPDTPEGKKELRAAAKAYLESMRGQMVDCPVLGAKVEIRQRGIKETMAFSGNPKKLKLLHAIPKVIGRATEALRSENHKQDKKIDVVAYFYLKSTVLLEGEALAVRVLIEQALNGHLYYDLMIDPPKEKAMLDSKASPRGADVSLITIQGNLPHKALLDSIIKNDERPVNEEAIGGQVLNLFLDDDVEQGEAIHAPATNALATGTQVQKNGSVLVTGDPVALMAYVVANFDANKVKQTDDGIVFSKSQARLAEYVPTSATTLASGAVIYEHDSLGGGASVAYEGETSGVARDLADLKGITAREWGPEKFRMVYGEEASPEDVQSYQDDQDALAQRKAANVAAEIEKAAAPEREREASEARAKVEAEELARTLARQEHFKREEFEKTIGAGVSGNPIYQAYLDTLEELPTSSSNAGFLGWAGVRAGEFERLSNGRVSSNKDEYLAYVRQWADEHLSERVKAEKVPAEPVAHGPLVITADTTDATIEGASDEQLQAKLLAVAKDFYRGLSHATKDIARRLEKGSYDRPEAIKALKQNRDYLIERVKAGAEWDADMMARMGQQYGGKSVAELDSIYEGMGGEISNLQSDREMNGGGRRTGPAVANEAARQLGQHRLELGIYIRARKQSEPQGPIVEPATPAAQHEIVEYTTKRDKVLRGIIRTDLTLAEAKAIDPYTWKMSGGYFIREKHLGEDTSHIPAASAPVVLSAEQQAEHVATAERQAAERSQKALAGQVQKLRIVADKAVSGGDAGMNADRNTNTARRAGMAASAIAKAAANKAAGQTLNNIADAIEAGAGGALAKLNSRAQLDQLLSAMRQAQYETDRSLSYGDQQSRRGRPFDDNDIKNLTFPRPMAWSNRYKNAALSMAKKAPTGNSRLIAALNKLGSGPERLHLNDEIAALTRKASAVLKSVGESWDLADPIEALAASDRLTRMGITDTPSLQAAVRELIPLQEAQAQEDPVKKAERAIIGQKVGIDFFPTPAHLAQRMARLAHITKDTRVLEPSAGNGNLADAAKADGGVVDVIEISSQLRDILSAKGYTVVGTDFESFIPEKPYQAILMNPPFSKRQDAAHIMRAYTMLAGGGRLVAIAGEGVFFGQDQKAVAFRDWLDSHGAEVETLEGGTFKDNALLAQTSANARMIILTK